jgi:hypothetical protein
MTDTRRSRRAIGGGLLLLGLATAFAACGSAVSSSSSPSATTAPPTATSPSASAPPSASAVPLDIETVIRDQDALGGSRIAVRGFILIEGNRARMCSLVLESYPPQCGGSTLEVRGNVPPAIVGQLDSTADEPTLNQAAWGDVIVTGTLAAAGSGGDPVIDLDGMTVVTPG